jgi:hypothetical protein
MSKAQTDIRTTSYDARHANPDGYVGTIDDALAQIRDSRDFIVVGPQARAELLKYLGVDRIPSAGPSVELDTDPRYGDEEPAFYTLAYAQKYFPQCFSRDDTA